MIRVLVQGGLGNQMFQTAFGISMMKKYDNQLQFICIKNRFKVNYYFEIKHVKFDVNQLFGYVISIFRKFFPNNYFDFFNIIRLSDYETYEHNLRLIKENGTYEGTFSSLDYFLNIQNEIKSNFCIKQAFVKEYTDAFGYLQASKTIVLHFRRTDYKTFGNENFGNTDLSLPIDYYKKALSLIPNIEQYIIIAIGDNIDGITEELEGLVIKTYRNSEIVDFQLLMNATIVIAANSTFSWWASFLNIKAELIFMPKYWLGFHIKKQIPQTILSSHPENWCLIDF